jgi:hypothetical protein
VVLVIDISREMLATVDVISGDGWTARLHVMSGCASPRGCDNDRCNKSSHAK